MEHLPNLRVACDTSDDVWARPFVIVERAAAEKKAGTTGSSGRAGAQNFWVNHGRHFNEWYVMVPMIKQWYGLVP
jgi:hypothetical protein